MAGALLDAPAISSSPDISVSTTNGAAELPSPSGAVAGGAFDGECRGDSGGGEDSGGYDKCDFHFCFLLSSDDRPRRTSDEPRGMGGKVVPGQADETAHFTPLARRRKVCI
jgi:hypothetical protein